MVTAVRHLGRWIPNQHGAWAMLATPYLAGALRGGLTWAHLGVFVWWLVGYFAFFAVGVWLRSRRRPRYRAPALAYSVAAAVGGALILAWRPSLAWWAPAFLPLAAASLAYSWRRDDRALANDGITIAAACLFSLVAFQVGVGSGPDFDEPPWRDMAWVAAALFSYFFGTSLYVKTLIRERRSRGYRIASIGYHGVITLAWAAAPSLGAPVPASTGWLLTGFFALMTVRAAALAGRSAPPMRIGLGELAASAAILAITVAW